LKKVRSRRDPLWNKVPSYGVDALISSINGPQELTLALQSEYLERKALKRKSCSEGKARYLKKHDFEIFSDNPSPQGCPLICPLLIQILLEPYMLFVNHMIALI
jgi:hypothetical protein